MDVTETKATRQDVAAFRSELSGVVQDARAKGIPAFCIRRELRGHLAGLAEGEEDGRLWCIFVIGPGSIIAQPSSAVAKARAELWNGDIEKMLSEREVSEYDPIVYCVPKPWTGSVEDHAAELAEHGGEPEDIC
jgi:hypothetical protein